MPTRAPKPIYTKIYTDFSQLPALLTRDEVAWWFRVSVITVDNWVRSGKLKPVKIGGITRFNKSELLEVR